MPYRRTSHTAGSRVSTSHPAVWLAAAVAALTTLLLPAPLQAAPRGSFPRDFLPASDFTLLVASRPVDGIDFADLWRTDGTAAGTFRLAVCPATCNPRVETVAASGELGFFTAYGSDLRWQVWRSDGTQGGTLRLTDFQSIGFPPGEIGFLWAPQQELLYFVAELAEGWTWWASDGTAAGTRRLATFAPVVTQRPLGLVEHQGEAWLIAVTDVVTQPGETPEYRFDLWSSRGTAASTSQRAEIAAFVPPNHGPLGQRELMSVGNGLFFATQDGDGQRKLWATDGTAAGTGPFAGFTGDLDFTPDLRQVDGFTYFWGLDSTHGRQLWRTDGTVAGTRRITEIPGGNFYGGLYDPLPLGGGVAFGASTPQHGYEIWYSDGTAAGSRLLVETCPGLCTDLQALVHSTGERIYYTGVGAWSSDGTPAGTRKLSDMLCQPLPNGPGLTALDGTLYLTCAADYNETPQLWGLDLASEQLLQLTDWPTGGGINTASRAGTAGDRLLLSVDDRSHGTEPWVSDGTPEGTHLLADLLTGHDDVTECYPSDDTLCLHGGRFRVTIDWSDQHNDRTGTGHAIHSADSDRSGYFWFFKPDNLELIVKVLDGTSLNDFYWTFYGALTDVEYWLTVHDTLTGGSRTYHNPPGEICGEGDTTSLPAAASNVTAGSTARPFRLLELSAPRATAAAHPEQPCVEDATTLCLLGGRYRVTVDWQDQHNQRTGVGGAVPYADRSGFFWFFKPDNIELVVKVLDGTPVNGKVWVLYGALTDVGYTITVIDTATGHDVRQYVNEPYSLCGDADTAAFDAAL